MIIVRRLFRQRIYAILAMLSIFLSIAFDWSVSKIALEVLSAVFIFLILDITDDTLEDIRKDL